MNDTTYDYKEDYKQTRARKTHTCSFSSWCERFPNPFIDKGELYFRWNGPHWAWGQVDEDNPDAIALVKICQECFEREDKWR